MNLNNCIIVRDKDAYKASLKQYLCALPSFPNSKGFCHRTILVSAPDEASARQTALRLSGASYVGDVKQSEA